MSIVASSQARCNVCDKPIVIIPGHRFRRYCSDVCKQRTFKGNAMKRLYASLRSKYPTFTEETLDILIGLEMSGNHEGAENLVRVASLELGYEPDPFPWISLYTKGYWRRSHARQLQRAEEAGLEATLTINAWMQTVRGFGGLCVYCRGCAGVVIDHILPISRGGGTTIDNCVPACSRCNGSKADKVLKDWTTPEVSDRIKRFLEDIH